MDPDHVPRPVVAYGFATENFDHIELWIFTATPRANTVCSTREAGRSVVAAPERGLLRNLRQAKPIRGTSRRRLPADKEILRSMNAPIVRILA